MKLLKNPSRFTGGLTAATLVTVLSGCTDTPEAPDCHEEVAELRRHVAGLREQVDALRRRVAELEAKEAGQETPKKPSEGLVIESPKGAPFNGSFPRTHYYRHDWIKNGTRD